MKPIATAIAMALFVTSFGLAGAIPATAQEAATPPAPPPPEHTAPADTATPAARAQHRMGRPMQRLGFVEFACSPRAAESLDVAFTRLSHRLKLTDAQQPSFDALRTTVLTEQTKFADAWFEGGQNDPRVSVLSVRPTGGHYWETQAGKLVAFAKMSFAALTGARVDDGGRDGSLTL